MRVLALIRYILHAINSRLSHDFGVNFISNFFRARATNTQLGQEENSEFITLSVDTDLVTDVPPEIIVPPRNITVTRQKSVAELQCIANARPLHLLSLIWLKDGTPIEQSSIPYSFNDLWNRTLSLYSIDFVHDGVYTCQVRYVRVDLFLGCDQLVRLIILL